MTKEYRGPELVRDDDLTRELRLIYAAPAITAWWDDLERRINARIDAADEWWTVPERWLRVGLVAAGLAVIVAGALIMRSQTQVTRMAYETVVDPATIDILEVAQRGKLTEQQAALRVLTGR